MEKKANKKILFPVLAIVVIALLLLMWKLFGGSAPVTDYDVSLSQRDVAIEKGEEVQLQIVPNKEKYADLNVKIKWHSSDPEVATVDKDGTVVGKDGGEARIKAIVSYAGNEYSASCIVTIKDSDEEYSIYKIRWFTQTKDRGTYEVKEEVFERLVGSKVELTEKEAKAKVPSQYVLNTKKSRLTGTVQENRNACVLEVYYDVAEVTYSVNYYFETEELGTYKLGESKKYKAYAFTAVEAPALGKEGFVLESSAKGNVLKKKELTAGTTLKAYYSRIRSKVTISYLDGRKDATYSCVYGVGLVNAPASALKDSFDLFPIATYLNGEKKVINEKTVKLIAADSKVAFQVDGNGFTYLPTDGGTLLNTSKEKAQSCYAYLKGSSDTIYLTATYTTTGSKDNIFGVTVRNGKESREIRFQSQGVAVTKNHTQDGGTLNEAMPVYYYNFAGRDGTTCVFAQNAFGTLGTSINSEINNMLTNTLGGSYDIVWAVWEGTLYGSLDGVPVVRLPLNLLNESWTADKKYEIGFSSFDGIFAGDELKITDINVLYGAKAEDKLITDQTIEYTEKHRVDYEPLTGSYIPASINGPSYIYGTESKENSGISTTLKWLDTKNSVARVGITVKLGDKTEQFVIDGDRGAIYHDSNYTWGTAFITEQILRNASTFDKEGKCQVTAVVKDGDFYLQFNGKQALCIKLHALFPEYTRDSKVSLGVYTYNACVGQTHFQNMKVLSAEEVDALPLDEWKFYSEVITYDDYSFAEGTVLKTTGGNTAVKEVILYGQSDAWQIEGDMTRTDTSRNKNLIMGFAVQSGDKEVWLGGMTYGFVKVVNRQWGAVGGTSATIHAVGVDKYSVNDKTISFFGAANGTKDRTLDEMGFKVAIYKDVFYAWFDGELCWRVPLTEEQFGGFAAGSEYTVTLRVGEDADASPRTGGFKDLEVKMGYEVTEQKNFEKNIATVDKNVTRWDSYLAKRLTGEFAEDVDELYTYAYTGKPYAYLKQASTDVYLSATYNQYADQSEGFGITIIQGDETREIAFLNEGLQIRSNRTDTISGAPGIVDGKPNTFAFAHMPSAGYGYGDYLWAPNIFGTDGTTKNIPIYNLTRTADNKTAYDVVWAITDGVLYGSLDGVPFVQMPLTVLCADWTADKEYQIGFYCNDNYSSKIKFTNIVDLYGDEAKAKFITNKKITVAEVSQFSYEVLTGCYMPNSSDGAKYMYGAASTEAQAMKATIQLLDKAGAGSLNGITVKAGNQTAQVVVQGFGNNIKLLINQNVANVHSMTAKLPTDAVIYNDSGVCQMAAVVKNDTLYVLCNNVQVASVSLNKILSGYKAGDAVQLGIFAYNSSIGSAKYKDIQFVTGEDVNAITLGNTPTWNDVTFFTSEIHQAGVSHINGTINNISNKEMLVRFQGESEKWEISGKMKRTDAMRAAAWNFGFNIKVGDKNLRFDAVNQGIVFEKASHNERYPYHAFGVTAYNLNTNIRNFINSPRRASELNFKVVIANDTFYAYFGYPNQELTLTWVIPLAEGLYETDGTTQFFAGFGANSKYNLGFFSPATTGLATYSDLVVKTGDAVTPPAVEKFKVAENQSATVNALAGTIANQSNKQMLVRLQDENTKWEISGKMKRTDAVSAQSCNFGFNIQVGTKVLRFDAVNQGIVFEASTDNARYPYHAFGATAYNLNTDISKFISSPRTKSEMNFKVVIANDTFYAWFGYPGEEMKLSWQFPLAGPLYQTDGTTQFFAGFGANSKYNVGFFVPATAGLITYSDLTVKKGNAVDLSFLSGNSN